MLLVGLGCQARPATTANDGSSKTDAPGPPPCTVGGTMAGMSITVACGQKSPAKIVVGGDSVFWTNEIPGVIVSTASRAGGAPRTVVVGNAPAFGIAVDETTVYWTEPTSGKVMKVARSGGQPVTVASGLNNPLHLVTDGTNLYWTAGRRRPNEADGGELDGGETDAGDTDGGGTDGRNADGGRTDAGQSDGGSIGTVSLRPGSKPSTLVSGLSRPNAIAVDDQALYWTDLADGTVSKLPKQPSGSSGAPTPVRLADGSRQPGDLALANGHLYWTDQGGRVWHVGRNGGDAEVLASGQDSPSGVAADEQYVYWTAVAAGTVMRVPVRGGAATVVADGQDEPYFITVDDTSVYWTNRGSGGRVTKAAK